MMPHPYIAERFRIRAAAVGAEPGPIPHTPAKCPAWKRSLPPNVTSEDQSRNGVRVLVRRFDGGTTVEADCSCFGSDFRVHSQPDCPNRLRQTAMVGAL
jgi:hypothetical protein